LELLTRVLARLFGDERNSLVRKIIIDCDPGIDDAVALALALFDARLEVLAVTAVAGKTSADHATCNVQALIERLDPPRYPRIGAASPPDTGPGVDARDLHGEDGLGNVNYDCSRLARQHPAEKIIADEIRAAPNEVSVLCLGPLTNIARAFQRDPALLEMIDQLVISGGAVNCIGNVTAAAEFNMYFDPESARAVFKAPVTKTLVPLDVTERVKFDLGLMHQLPPESSRVGQVLRSIMPYYCRSYRQQLGLELFTLPDVVALVALTNPELFETVEMQGDVEICGELTTGATIFDRRPTFRGLQNMDVAKELDVNAVTDCILRGLTESGRLSPR
jgi:inosine-uridine nucleoside N-ribohydrolase